MWRRWDFWFIWLGVSATLGTIIGATGAYMGYDHISPYFSSTIGFIWGWWWYHNAHKYLPEKD